MQTSEKQRQNYPHTSDNTHGGNNLVNVSNVTSTKNIIANKGHIDNTHGGLNKTPVNSVTITLEQESNGNNSLYSNIHQGARADTISLGPNNCELHGYVHPTLSLTQNNTDISPNCIPQGPCEPSQYESSDYFCKEIQSDRNYIYNHVAANDQSQYVLSTNPQSTRVSNTHYSQISELSDIFQGDGADSVNDLSYPHSVDTDYSTEDEAYTDREPAVLVPASQQPGPGQPLVLEVDESGRMVLPSSLPLIMVTNARSV